MFTASSMDMYLHAHDTLGLIMRLFFLQFFLTFSGDPESDGEGPPAKIIKEESDHAPSCSRDVSGTADPTPATHISYPVQALVDIPMNPPLARSSRTSSLSSSLSSFRFGGSLSQLWASQVSLTARLPNMKSTG